MTFVVFDTTVLYGHPFLTGAEFDAINTVGYSLRLPAVVTEESKRHFERSLQKLDSEVKRAQERLADLTGDEKVVTIKSDKVASAIDNYLKRLNRRLSSLAGAMLEYPSVSHKNLVEHEMSGRKPFAESGKGYRDSLIWYSIIELAQSDADAKQIILVTANKFDFAGNDGSLHADLKNSLVDHGIQESRVILVANVHELYEKHIRIHLEELSEIRAKLNAGKFKELNIENWIEENLHRQLAGTEFEGHDLGFPEGYDTCHFDSVDSVQACEVKDVRRLDADRILISVTSDIEATFDAFVYKPDYYAMDDDESPSIVDWDWNDHYAWATDSTTISVAILLTFNMITKDVEEASIDEVKATG